MNVLTKDLDLRVAPDYTKLLIQQSATFTAPVSVFNVNGVPMLTKGSLSLGIAKAKAGKTTCTAWIVSQMLLQGLKVIWIDTEQGNYYGSRTQAWILKMAFKDTCENLMYYNLRAISPSERMEAIDQILYTFKTDVVVIDGTRDLVYDINSPAESTEVVTDLMRFSEVFDCHIINILHVNKGDGNARGHLGSELNNKTETVFKVETNEAKEIIVSPEYTRSEPFEAFALTRGEGGLPYLVKDWAAVESKSGKKTLKLPFQIEDEMHLVALNKTFSIDTCMNATNFYSEFVTSYATLFFDVSDRMTGNRAKLFLNYYVEKDFLTVEKGIRNNEKIYALNPNKIAETPLI